jgi:DnaK suppressor protein
MTKKVNKEKAVKSNKSEVLTFPASLLVPVGNFLQARLSDLRRRKKELDSEDPFRDTSRLLDNASPDTDAAEQFGHARTSAVKQQITKAIIQTRKASTRVKIGKYGICEDCAQMIDTDRLAIYPEATRCAKCQAKREK